MGVVNLVFALHNRLYLKNKLTELNEFLHAATNLFKLKIDLKDD